MISRAILTQTGLIAPCSDYSISPFMECEFYIIQGENKKYQQAIASYDKLIALLTAKSLHYLQQAEFYEIIGERQKAKAILQQGLMNNPENKELKTALEKLINILYDQ